MIGPCSPVGTGGAFLRAVIASLDCQAQTIGAAGYQALASPTSATSIALSSLLTIFVAVFGVRMLLGYVPDIRDGTLAVLKIAVVLALATSWGAFRPVIYDLMLYGPAQIASAIGLASRLPGTSGDMAARLQNVDDLIVYLANLGIGPASFTTDATGQARLASPLISDGVAFGTARTAFLVITIGAVAFVRLATGTLLALAPLFAGFLLFSATRGLFVGWLRALFALLLGAIIMTMIFAVELAILESWLANVSERRLAGLPAHSAPNELLAVVIAFGGALIGLFVLAGRLAFMLHIPALWLQHVRGAIGAAGGVRIDTGEQSRTQPIASGPNRAARVSDAIERGDRRALHMAEVASLSRASSSSQRDIAAAASPLPAARAQASQRSYRARPRVSASARRRDR